MGGLWVVDIDDEGGLSTVEALGRTRVAIIGGTGYVGRLLAR